MKLRVFDLAGGDMDYDMNSVFKNPSVLPLEVLSGKDPLLKVMLSTEKLDMHGNEIFQGDIVEFENAAHIMRRAICEFGTVKRELVGETEDVLCEITGFYFRLIGPNKATFPIVQNYQGISDYELFDVIGNIYENPELIK